MLIAVIVLSVLSLILFIFSVLFFAVSVYYYKQTSELKECADLLEHENKHYFNEMIAAKLNYMIYIMNMCKISYELDNYSKLYNQLYFFGISKEILDDNEKSMKFIEDIQNDLYVIEESEPPFQYKFIYKESK